MATQRVSGVFGQAAWPQGVSTRLVHAIPGTQAHKLPLYGDGRTVLCGRTATFLRWRDGYGGAIQLCSGCARLSR